MKRSFKIFLIACGLLMLAAVPVLAQEDDPVYEVKFNQDAVAGYADFLIEKIEKDKVDLSLPFKVVYEGSLVRQTVTKETDGEFQFVGFDLGSSKWIDLPAEEAGDPGVGGIAKKAIVAYGDSGLFGHFYNLGIKEVRITLRQDNEKVFMVVESEQESPERARVLASGFSGLIAIAQSTLKDGTDEQILMYGASKTLPFSRGNRVIINFELPKEVARDMIDRNLAQYKVWKLSEQK